MEQRYVEPTSGGRIRVLGLMVVYLLGGTLLYWLAGIYDRRNTAILAKYSAADSSSSGNHLEAMVHVVSQQLLEAAWIRFLAFLPMVGHIVWKTRAIQIAGQWPTPNEIVLFRTRVRSDPRYIKSAVALGYMTSGIVLLNGLLGFYAWYGFRSIFSSFFN